MFMEQRYKLNFINSKGFEYFSVLVIKNLHTIIERLAETTEKKMINW